MTAFEDLLSDPYARRMYLLEMTVYDKVNLVEKTLYFSGGKGGFVTEPDDTPSNQEYESRLLVPLVFSQSLYSDGQVSGESIPGYGAITIVNADGALDSFINYAVDGRRCVVKLGRPEFTFSDFGVVFDGTMESIEFSNTTVEVKVRDLQHVLSVPLQQTVYSGSGGWNGTAELTGRVVPHCYGRVRNAEPVLVDAPNLRYQIHYRAVSQIDSVRDKGVSLTNFGDYASLALLDAAAIPAGDYATCLAQGCFKLGSSPVGQVTFDAVGDSVGGATSDTSTLVKRIAQDVGLLTGFDTASFTALTTLNNAVNGIYEAEQITISEALTKLVNSIGAFYTFDRAGQMTVGRIDTPAGTPSAIFTKQEILSFVRKPTVTPNWRIKLGYKPNLRNLSQNELASSFLPGGINASQNSSLTDEFRYVISEDSAVKTVHLLAVDQEILTTLDDSTEAQAESDRLLAMFKVSRDVYTVKVKTQPLSRKLGEIIQLVHSRYGLSNGKLFTIVGLVEDYVSSTVEMEVWG